MCQSTCTQMNWLTLVQWTGGWCLSWRALVWGFCWINKPLGSPVGRGTRGSWSSHGGSGTREERDEALSEGERLGGEERSWKSLRKFYTVGYDVMLSFSPFKAFSKNYNNHQRFALEFNVAVWPKDEKRANIGATKGAPATNRLHL